MNALTFDICRQVYKNCEALSPLAIFGIAVMTILTTFLVWWICGRILLSGHKPDSFSTEESLGENEVSSPAKESDEKDQCLTASLFLGTMTSVLTIVDINDVERYDDDTILITTSAGLSHNISMFHQELLCVVGLPKADARTDDVTHVSIWAGGQPVYKADLYDVDWTKFDGTRIDGWQEDGSIATLFLGKQLTTHLEAR